MPATPLMEAFDDFRMQTAQRLRDLNRAAPTATATKRTAVDRYPILAPLALEHLPQHDGEHIRINYLWVKMGSPGCSSTLRHCLKDLEVDGLVESTLQPTHGAMAARVYRKTEIVPAGSE